MPYKMKCENTNIMHYQSRSTSGTLLIVVVEIIPIRSTEPRTLRLETTVLTGQFRLTETWASKHFRAMQKQLQCKQYIIGFACLLPRSKTRGQWPLIVSVRQQSHFFTNKYISKLSHIGNIGPRLHTRG